MKYPCQRGSRGVVKVNILLKTAQRFNFVDKHKDSEYTIPRVTPACDDGKGGFLYQKGVKKLRGREVNYKDSP